MFYLIFLLSVNIINREITKKKLSCNKKKIWRWIRIEFVEFCLNSCNIKEKWREKKIWNGRFVRISRVEVALTSNYVISIFVFRLFVCFCFVFYWLELRSQRPHSSAVNLGFHSFLLIRFLHFSFSSFFFFFFFFCLFRFFFKEKKRIQNKNKINWKNLKLECENSSSSFFLL